jgi:hypothetical protein
MKGKDKNKKSELSDFLRYKDGEMTSPERNAFERELQRAPFEEDAAEGLSEISNEEAVSDLRDLEKRLKARIFRKQRSIYYSIAASVAVLMIISSVFIIINKNKPAGELAKVGAVQAPIEISEPKGIKEPEKAELQDRISTTEKRVSEEVKEEIVQDKPEQITGEKHEYAVAAISENQVPPVMEDVAGEEIAAPVAGAPLKRPSLSGVRGKIISSEDNLPISGAMVKVKGTNTGVITNTDGTFNITLAEASGKTLVADFIGMEPKEFQAKEDTDIQIRLDPSVLALSEVVVVGYDGSKESRENAGYSPPQPSDGKNSFDQYIEKNIRNPASLPAGQRAVVVLNFLVRNTGSIDSIKVIMSPGPEFSQEAIRLIKEGPNWKPAEENGTIIDDDIRLRIVFK